MSIKQILNEYHSKCKEMNNINKDIIAYRDTFKPRLCQLKKEIEQLTNLIQKYLDEHNHPGLTYNGITVKQKQVKRVTNRKNRKSKEKDLHHLKNQYNLSDECYEDILDQIIGKQRDQNKLIVK